MWCCRRKPPQVGKATTPEDAPASPGDVRVSSWANAEPSRKSLFGAVEDDDAIGVTSLLSRGVDVNAKDDEDGYTALILAAEGGAGECVNALLAAGAEVEERDSFGRSSLYAAAASGKADSAKRLLDAGADVDATDQDFRTPLWAACALRHLEVAAVLVERGADLNSPDREGLTPAQHAARHGHADVLEFLEEHGAEDDRGRLSLPATPSAVSPRLALPDFDLPPVVEVGA